MVNHTRQVEPILHKTSLRQRMLLVIIVASFLSTSIQIAAIIAFVHRSNSTTNWTIVSGISGTEVYSISRNAIILLTIITTFMWCIAAVASVYSLNRMFIWPIRALREGAERIGDGLLDHKVQVYRSDEIGQVAIAFNQMVYRLRQREEELKSQTLTLSSEVEERKRAQSEAQRRFVEQLALQEASMSLTIAQDSSDLLVRIAEQICKALDATSVYIMELDIENSQSIVIAEFFGSEACELEKVSDLDVVYFETNTDFIEAMKSQTFWADSIDEYAPDDDMYLHLLEFGVKSRLFVPLHVRGKVIGFAEIWESRCIRKFTQDEMNLCKAIAQNAAIGLDNFRLYQETKMQLEERKRAELALRNLNEQLEQRVAIRTSELLAANDLLKQEIAERKQIEQSLRKSEERYSLAARGANDGLWDWDITENKIFLSPRWKRMLGLEDDDISDDPVEWLKRIHPEDAKRVQVELDAHLEGIAPQFESEHRMLHKDGSYRWMLTRGLAVRDENSKAYRFAGSQTDITDRKRAEQQLSHDALHDALTGLPNRTLFLDRLDRALEISRRREDYIFAVLFLDTDRFKLINDSLGHATGDELLGAISKRLQTSLRETDTVARLGGDEFVILLEDIDEANEAIKVADRIQKKFTRPFSIDSHEIYLSISMGIILNDPSYEKPTDLLSDADIAMYRAKAQGRAQYVIFESKMRTSVMARLQVENDMRRALDNEEFCLHYQPIITLGTGSLIGFEALVRWQHPEAGLIPPGEFIPVAEESGLILPLGRWILTEACRQMREWQEHYPDYATLSVSVNLSSLQFRQFDLAEQVEAVLAETGLDPQYLKLEITESLILEDANSINETIQKLKSLGVQVFIDDFGTGYSSLGYLQKFPIDTIKIDRSFVQRIDANGENGDLVKAILNLARELKLSVIAEGIETERQVSQLRELACQYGQGFYFSKPIEANRVDTLFSTNLLISEKGLLAS